VGVGSQRQTISTRDASGRGGPDYCIRACTSRKLYDRLEALPQNVRDIAWKAQGRLCTRWRRLAANGKRKVSIMTAIARETAGFCLVQPQALDHQNELNPTGRTPNIVISEAPAAGGRAIAGNPLRGRHVPTLVPRTRQPRGNTATRAESLLTGVLSLPPAVLLVSIRRKPETRDYVLTANIRAGR
jgi:hypothetical protein